MGRPSTYRKTNSHRFQACLRSKEPAAPSANVISIMPFLSKSCTNRKG